MAEDTHTFIGCGNFFLYNCLPVFFDFFLHCGFSYFIICDDLPVFIIKKKLQSYLG